MGLVRHEGSKESAHPGLGPVEDGAECAPAGADGAAGGRRRVPDATLDAINSAREDGLTIRQIAGKFGVSVGKVHGAIKAGEETAAPKVRVRQRKRTSSASD